MSIHITSIYCVSCVQRSFNRRYNSIPSAISTISNIITIIIIINVTRSIFYATVITVNKRFSLVDGSDKS